MTGSVCIYTSSVPTYSSAENCQPAFGSFFHARREKEVTGVFNASTHYMGEGVDNTSQEKQARDLSLSLQVRFRRQTALSSS